MTMHRRLALLAAGFLLTGALARLPPLSGSEAGKTPARPRRLAPLPREVPTPPQNPSTAAKIALGKQLFFDPRLSGGNEMSCATCHLPDKGFGDGLPTARGDQGKSLSRNTPTLLNIAFFENFFWDGRAATLEEQALGPIQNPDEMHQDLEELERELNAVPGYVSQFQEVFGKPAGRQEIAQALAAFQRTLVTGPSSFDRFLAGDKTALSAAAQQGLELFRGGAGCIRCHDGPLLSDSRFYRLGIPSKDDGRAGVSHDAKDRGKFRTPSLRNIAQTGPYMHNGSLTTLTEVVEFYYRGVPASGSDGQPLDVQPLLGQSFSEIPALVAFLESLTGEPPQVERPELP